MKVVLVPYFWHHSFMTNAAFSNMEIRVMKQAGRLSALFLIFQVSILDPLSFPGEVAFILLISHHCGRQWEISTGIQIIFDRSMYGRKLCCSFQCQARELALKYIRLQLQSFMGLLARDNEIRSKN